MARARILIVEDEGIVAMGLRRRLEHLEYVVTAIVASGEEAIEKAAETQPDLALMDIVLKGAMDGIDTAERIRERLNIPVVYLTAYSDDKTLQRAKITEPFGYILKPFEERELCATIEMALYRHRAEEELRQHRDHLEELVKERTAELTRANEQLRQEMAERKEMEERLVRQERLSAVGQLAAGIAHDFNNLLTGIIGYAELLEMRADIPDDAKVDLRNIEGEGQRAAELVRQILDFSRKSIIQRKPLNLLPFLKESIQFLQRTVPENVDISLDTDRGAYAVNADPAQIQQVLTNLAVNARDAMPEGGELTFYLSRFTLASGERPPVPEMPPGEWIKLLVLDTGEGIPADVKPRIFEPFFTTKDPTREHGTGLGLAQVHGIVMQHEGFIDVDSEEGEGATFVLYLPALDVPEEVSGEAPSEEYSWGGGETILVVEDEPVVREMLGKMLERLGYRVLTAAGSREALELYERHDVVLVLTDMVMPGMGGVELFQTLREQDPEAKVIMMTGYSLGQEEKELLSQGVVAWLEKPIGFSSLTRIVEEALT